MRFRYFSPSPVFRQSICRLLDPACVIYSLTLSPDAEDTDPVIRIAASHDQATRTKIHTFLEMT